MKPKQAEQKARQIASEVMRRTSLALTPEQRQANGRKAWQTRLANIAKAISVSANNTK